VSGPEKSAKNALDLISNLVRFGTVFALCGVFLKVFFGCVFRSAPFAHFGRFCGPGVAKREAFGDHFEAIWMKGPTCENRRFTCTAAQFRGFRRVRKSSISERFGGRGKKWPPGGHFSGFSSFLGVPGGPSGDPLWFKNAFFGGSKKSTKKPQNKAPERRGRRHGGLGCGDLGKVPFPRKACKNTRGKR